MAFLVIDSFGWAVSGSPSIWATRYNSTTPAMSILATSGPFGDGCFAISGANVATINLRAVITPTIRIGLYIWSDNWATATTTGQLVAILGDAAAVQCYMSVNGATKTIQFRNGANVLLGSGTKVLQNNSFYFVEILVTVSNAAGTVVVSVEGVNDINAGPVDTQNVATTNITGIQLRGVVTNQTRYSNLFVADGGALQGPSRVSLLTPNADGAASAWTPSTGVTLFSLVDEIPPNGDTDYISSATPTQQALFGFTDLPYNPATVYAVQVSLYARKDDAAARSIAPLVRSNGTTVTGTPQVLTTSYLDFYLQIYPLDPVTLAAWTPAGVNAIEAGVECVL